MKYTILGLLAAALTSCVTNTDPTTGVVTKKMDPAVTAAAIAILKTPEGKAVTDALVAKAVEKINPPPAK
jgi:hypothetical protein